MYADAQATQHAPPHPPPPVIYNVTWSRYYDDSRGNTSKVTCSILDRRYPRFGDFPHFPYIGGGWNVHNPAICGSCWNLTNVKTHKRISVTVIDHAKSGYNISLEAFNVLNGGLVGSKTLQAVATPVDTKYCGHIKK